MVCLSACINMKLYAVGVPASCGLLGRGQLILSSSHVVVLKKNKYVKIFIRAGDPDSRLFSLLDPDPGK